MLDRRNEIVHNCDYDGKNSLQVILLVCRNNYGKEDTILSFINKLSVIYFCFLLFSKWLNHNFIFFTAYVKDYTHVSN